MPSYVSKISKKLSKFVKTRVFQRTTLLGIAALALLWGVDSAKIDEIAKLVGSLVALEAIVYNERKPDNGVSESPR